MRELQFSTNETTELFTQAVNHPIPREIICRLQESTEGWPVGIRLAALALQRAPRCASTDLRVHLPHSAVPLQLPLHAHWGACLRHARQLQGRWVPRGASL